MELLMMPAFVAVSMLMSFVPTPRKEGEVIKLADHPLAIKRWKKREG